MTKLTNCSIIASRGRRSSDGGGLRGACTSHARPPTNQLSLPEFLSLRTPRLATKSTQIEFSCPDSLRSARNRPRLPATRSPECSPRAAGPGERGEERVLGEGSPRPPLRLRWRRRDEAGNGVGGARRLRRDGSRQRQCGVWRGKCER